MGEEVIKNFQNEMMELGKNANFEISKEKRYIFSNTITCSDTGRERIIERMKQFKKEIIQMDEQEKHIYQFNVQFFPFSNLEE